MNHYLLTIQYEGSRYSGWQVQAQGLTIQGEFNKALAQVCKSDEVKSLASGRTDAGVHAFGQKVRVDIPLDIPPAKLVRALNTRLPSDIRVVEGVVVGPGFHPIRDSLWKEYIYVFSSEYRPTPFAAGRVSCRPYELDLKAMRDAAECFIGKHDFNNFRTVGTEVPDTVKTIEISDISLVRDEGHWARYCPEYYLYRVRGNGFMKQMVRLMVGAIWDAGRGRVSCGDIEDALSCVDNRKVAAVAPPDGLYLNEVFYPDHVLLGT